MNQQQPFHATGVGRIFFTTQVPQFLYQFGRLVKTLMSNNAQQPTMRPSEIDHQYPGLRPMITDLVEALDVWNISEKEVYEFLDGYPVWGVSHDTSDPNNKKCRVYVELPGTIVSTTDKDLFSAGVRLMHKLVVGAPKP